MPPSAYIITPLYSLAFVSTSLCFEQIKLTRNRNMCRYFQLSLACSKSIGLYQDEYQNETVRILAVSSIISLRRYLYLNFCRRDGHIIDQLGKTILPIRALDWMGRFIMNSGFALRNRYLQLFFLFNTTAVCPHSLFLNILCLYL